MDDLESKWEHFYFTVEEQLPLNVDEGPEDLDNGKSWRSLLGKLFSNRNIVKDIIQATMKKICKVSKQAVFKEMNQNLFTTTFTTKGGQSKNTRRKTMAI